MPSQSIILEEFESLCQPTVEPGGQSHSPGSTTKGRPGPHDPNLEDTDLVPNNPENVQGFPTGYTTRNQLNPADTPPGNARCHPPTGRVEYLRRRYREHHLSEKATELMLSSWRENSSKSYDSQFQKWLNWCSARSVDSVSCPVGDVVNFLADLFEQGYQYRSLNAYRSAISLVHDKVDGCDVGQHPLVSRLLQGAFHQRPLQPRYTQTWDMNIATSYIKTKGENQTLSLEYLSHKLAMLMAVTRPSRSADFAKLDHSRTR